MAANTSPLFVLTPNVSNTTSNTAVTVIDGTGALVSGLVSGANGSRLERIRVKCAATSVLANVNIFLFNGTTTTLLTQINVTAVTSSNTVPAFETILTLGLVLPTGYTVKWATTIAQATNVIFEGGDF